MSDKKISRIDIIGQNGATGEHYDELNIGYESAMVGVDYSNGTDKAEYCSYRVSFDRDQIIEDMSYIVKHSLDDDIRARAARYLPRNFNWEKK